jgi:hypothetical protein
MDSEPQKQRPIGFAILVGVLAAAAFVWAFWPSTRLLGNSGREPGGDHNAFIAITVVHLPVIGRRIASCRIGVERASKSVINADPGAEFCAEAIRDDGLKNQIVWSADGARVQFLAGNRRTSLDVVPH